ncbi:heme/hemin ABC transporter substrate-binding protein [Anianabacter salinae]|uniref:heme/hemin ABC transporter substrate-binding protein n=1 Tax=Anianabacter salinae TaxID=2851023 RepID=UPI00225E1BA9|nr:ABC transporter substrate-binding protein [Anianabacter salinae]MBV0912466.1 ABC transporter substrate-binding protein [Anianabacter salinae]
MPRLFLLPLKSLAASVSVLAFGLALAVLPGGARDAEAVEDDLRVLSIGGSVTEIVYALGQGDRLVARDTTSSFPPEAVALPDVGYIRALSPEGVLSVNPDLIISEEGAGPPEALDVLHAAAIDWVTVPEDPTAEGVAQKIRAVGAALGARDRAEALAATVEADLKAAAAKAAAHDGAPKRVLFILSTQGGRIMASGTGTAAAAIIGLAGGQNAITEFEGYKPLTDEAVSQAAPDVILMMDRGGDHGAADDELFAMPALVTTPAAETRSVIRMDGLYLLGFGPRTAQAVSDLSAHLYGG